ncbi:MAG: hypothetical protein WAL05_05585, partial [Candidatus Sulfotelmatobacter sp.]
LKEKAIVEDERNCQIKIPLINGRLEDCFCRGGELHGRCRASTETLLPLSAIDTAGGTPTFLLLLSSHFPIHFPQFICR